MNGIYAFLYVLNRSIKSSLTFLFTEVGQEVWWSHQMLPECSQVGQGQCPNSEGSISPSDPDEGSWRL